VEKGAWKGGGPRDRPLGNMERGGDFGTGLTRENYLAVKSGRGEGEKSKSRGGSRPDEEKALLGTIFVVGWRTGEKVIYLCEKGSGIYPLRERGRKEINCKSGVFF